MQVRHAACRADSACLCTLYLISLVSYWTATGTALVQQAGTNMLIEHSDASIPKRPLKWKGLEVLVSRCLAHMGHDLRPDEPVTLTFYRSGTWQGLAAQREVPASLGRTPTHPPVFLVRKR